MNALIKVKPMLSVLGFLLMGACISRPVGPTADAQEQARRLLAGNGFTTSRLWTGYSKDRSAVDWNADALDPQSQARQMILGMPTFHFAEATIPSSGSTATDLRCSGSATDAQELARRLILGSNFEAAC